MEKTDAGGARGLVSNCRPSSALDSHAERSALWVEGLLISRLWFPNTTAEAQFTPFKARRTLVTMQKL